MFIKTNTEYHKFEEIYDVKQKSIKLINKQRLQGGGGGGGGVNVRYKWKPFCAA